LIRNIPAVTAAGAIKVLSTITTTVFGTPSIDAQWAKIGRSPRFGLKGE
jgi:hypothetical protein